MTVRKNDLLLFGIALALAAAAFLPLGPRLSTRLKCQRGPGADGTCQVTIQDTGRTIEASFPIHEVTRVGYDYYPYNPTDHPYRRLVIGTTEADYALSLYQYEPAHGEVYRKAEELIAFFTNPDCKTLDMVTRIPLNGPHALFPVGVLLAVIALARMLWSLFIDSTTEVRIASQTNSGTV